MPELRQNMATKEWIIIATERAKRPEQFVQPGHAHVADLPAYAPDCPFCPGNEELDLERLRVPDQGDWLLRVVQNRYPALQAGGERVRQFDGVHRSISGVGYHEIVVESRLHNTSPALESVEDVERTLTAFQRRGMAVRNDPPVEQIVFFKNHGLSAGASLLHPHAQLLTLPVVPYDIRTRVQEARRYFDDNGACVMCDVRKEEEHEHVRIVLESEWFTAFIPFAAYSPFHLWIVPRCHRPSFIDASPDEVHDLSYVLREILRKVYFGLNDPDYNYIIRCAPEHERRSEFLHWYVTLIPRVTRTAGFELGSGMFINTALPEESARFLRSVALP
ncbi:MAG TPA: galactose-1-phosphate uridylyltransferase [Roseiflexaceae bacterium]|jgi:UDPglucose--hexose-1-phosphate uridylyltransferase|nr:galactose-1-phosphate uridylyltransferase [Roseiflexaceae bacterium]